MVRRVVRLLYKNNRKSRHRRLKLIARPMLAVLTGRDVTRLDALPVMSAPGTHDLVCGRFLNMLEDFTVTDFDRVIAHAR